jgi:hypothetical protein
MRQEFRSRPMLTSERLGLSLGSRHLYRHKQHQTCREFRHMTLRLGRLKDQFSFGGNKIPTPLWARTSRRPSGIRVRVLYTWCTVRTGTYFGKFSHGSTYRYIPVRTGHSGTDKWPKVRTSSTSVLLVRTFGPGSLGVTVHGSTWQYMAVHGSTWQYMIVNFLVRTDSTFHAGHGMYCPKVLP